MRAHEILPARPARCLASACRNAGKRRVEIPRARTVGKRAKNGCYAKACASQALDVFTESHVNNDCSWAWTTASTTSRRRRVMDIEDEHTLRKKCAPCYEWQTLLLTNLLLRALAQNAAACSSWALAVVATPSHFATRAIMQPCVARCLRDPDVDEATHLLALVEHGLPRAAWFRARGTEKTKFRREDGKCCRWRRQLTHNLKLMKFGKDRTRHAGVDGKDRTDYMFQREAAHSNESEAGYLRKGRQARRSGGARQTVDAPKSEKRHQKWG
eukprot:6208041-Pleurochrysis_carterae.AAC.4